MLDEDARIHERIDMYGVTYMLLKKVYEGKANPDQVPNDLQELVQMMHEWLEKQNAYARVAKSSEQERTKLVQKYSMKWAELDDLPHTDILPSIYGIFKIIIQEHLARHPELL